jgi:hypothetical protein
MTGDLISATAPLPKKSSIQALCDHDYASKTQPQKLKIYLIKFETKL